MTTGHFIVRFADMPRHANTEPTYLYKEKDKGRIFWRGKTRVLPGRYKSAESWAEFHRLAAIIQETGDFPPDQTDQPLTMAHLGKFYLKAMRIKFGPDSREPVYLSYAIRDCNRLFGALSVDQFLPPQLKAVRAEIVKAGLCRRTANKRAQQLTRLIQWAVEEGHATPDQWHRLKAVEPIHQGQYGAKDMPAKRPVSLDHFERTAEYLRPEQRDAARVLLLTGMRTGELLAMRPQDVNMAGRHWLYTLSKHKTSKKTGSATVLIPEPAAIILAARMPRDYTRRWFPHTNTWLRIAVKRACERADVPHWHPHQLRHQFATIVASQIDDRVAQKLLRHHDPKMTARYVSQTEDELLRIAELLHPVEKVD